MEEKNELSDIMLDNNTDKTPRVKKILLVAIILIVLFLLILVGMKLFNKPSVKKNNFNIVLPPEPTAKVQPNKTNNELFKQVPIIEENNTQKNSFNAMVEKLKKREQQKQIPPTEKKLAPTVAKKQNAPSNNVKNVLSKINTKKIFHKTKSQKPKVKKYLKGNAYIQVGVTFESKPNKRYLKRISKLGYRYRLYSLKIAGKHATKILIGPYRDIKAAQRNISKIKKEINKAAFLYVIR